MYSLLYSGVSLLDQAPFVPLPLGEGCVVVNGSTSTCLVVLRPVTVLFALVVTCLAAFPLASLPTSLLFLLAPIHHDTRAGRAQVDVVEKASRKKKETGYSQAHK